MMDYSDLLKGLGEKLGGMTLEPDDAGAVTLEVDGMNVTIIGLEGAGFVVFSGLVGEPPPETGIERLYRAMLEANHAFAGTSGATLAIRPEDGEVELCQTLELANLETERFYARLEKFVNALEVWRKLVTDFRGALPAAEEAASRVQAPTFGAEGFMQI